MRYRADEKTEKDPQTPFMIVTRSASRKFLEKSVGQCSLQGRKRGIPDEREMAICVLVLMQDIVVVFGGRL
jgi:hypothetical protein